MLRRTPVNASNVANDARVAELGDWLQTIDGLAGTRPRPASVDASFRRYFRLQTDGDSFIAMDAPPAQEDCKPFVRVAGYLEAMQLSAPRVIEADLDRGFLLLTDLGSTHYLEQLESDPDSAARLYDDALGALATLQSLGTAYQALLPPYDDELLRFELSLFHDWLCEKHLGIQFDAKREADWQELCDSLVANALDQPQVFVHRDYHSRNLMVLDEGSPGILDFQDAVEGPLTYDLVSLLRDCYVRWPRETVHDWMLDFYSRMDTAMREQVDSQQFLRHFDLMGVQRHLKASGIFARLNHRDGKPGYMADIPLTLGYIVELAPDYPQLATLVALIENDVLPGLVATP